MKKEHKISKIILRYKNRQVLDLCIDSEGNLYKNSCSILSYDAEWFEDAIRWDRGLRDTEKANLEYLFKYVSDRAWGKSGGFKLPNLKTFIELNMKSLEEFYIDIFITEEVSNE